MTQEEKKDILIKDLCARLPYGVKCIVTKSRTEEGQKGDVGKIVCVCLEGVDCIDTSFFSEFGNFKPYLFPISNMTEEQSLELEIITGNSIGFDAYSLHDFTGYSEISLSRTMEIIRWCYENHLDINGLIPMGLANDATGLNIY